jgi:hypothetical protein
MSQMTKFKIEMSAHPSRIRLWAAHFERPMSSEWLKPKPNQQDNVSIFCIISQKLSKALILAAATRRPFRICEFDVRASNEAHLPARPILICRRGPTPST